MHNYFFGWYFKCQTNDQTLAIIPAYHTSHNGASCSIQLITNEGAFNISYPSHMFHKTKNCLYIGENVFQQNGFRLSIFSPDCTAIGSLQFKHLSPIRYDIMGPFKYIPFMQCRHSIFSMKHLIQGTVKLNGKNYFFSNGLGYMEGDRGHSFPKNYVWTQCLFSNGSLMLSAAEIPMGFFHFVGVIAVIHWKNKEYRLATYLGAKAVKIQDGEIIIRQNHLCLTAKLLTHHPHSLLAPENGNMKRVISESISCRASYCFQQNAHTIFSFETNQASFEYEYSDSFIL